MKDKYELIVVSVSTPACCPAPLLVAVGGINDLCRDLLTQFTCHPVPVQPRNYFVSAAECCGARLIRCACGAAEFCLQALLWAASVTWR